LTADPGAGPEIVWTAFFSIEHAASTAQHPSAAKDRMKVMA